MTMNGREGKTFIDIHQPISYCSRLDLKALGQYISGIRLLNLNTAITEQVNGNSTT